VSVQTNLGELKMSTVAIPTRPISTIAREISQEWKNVNYAARPYLDAMYSLNTIKDSYGMDDAKSIISYFLCNASSFRGPKAKELKAELKKIAGIK
jgi:hypothetical protein